MCAQYLFDVCKEEHAVLGSAEIVLWLIEHVFYFCFFGTAQAHPKRKGRGALAAARSEQQPQAAQGAPRHPTSAWLLI